MLKSLLTLTLFFTVVSFTFAQSTKNDNEILVEGVAKIKIKPDIAILTLTVEKIDSIEKRAIESKFPADRWKINLQTLGSKFYLEMKKDTVGYLNFAISNPVLYQYHFTALANTLTAKKQLQGETAKLFLQWANAIVNEESSMEIIKNAASLSKRIGNNEGYKKFIQMAINRAKKYAMPYQEIEESLKQASK